MPIVGVEGANIWQAQSDREMGSTMDVPLTFWGLKMILYFLLLPDILSALIISVETPHSPCTAAHPARHSSPRLPEPNHPGTSETPAAGLAKSPSGPEHRPQLRGSRLWDRTHRR